MLLTPEEAEGKWCPFSKALRVIQSPKRDSFINASVNRDEDGDSFYETTCLGPGCMCWRWARNQKGTRIQSDNGDYLGYCGLAGKPEE